MSMVRVRILVDDRPGSLAAVAKTLAARGADVLSIEVLGSDEGVAVDDFTLRLPDESVRDLVIKDLNALPGTTVESVRTSRLLHGQRPDLDALARVLKEPESALATYADQLPVALVADWAAVLEPQGRETNVAHRSPGAPLRIDVTVPAGGLLAARAITDGDRSIALAPIGRRYMVVARENGPTFRRQELLHLQRLTEIVLLLTKVAGTGSPSTDA